MSIIGILTFVSMVNFKLFWVEHEKGYDVFILLIGVKMPTVVHILSFMSMMNSCLVDHEGGFIDLRSYRWKSK